MKDIQIIYWGFPLRFGKVSKEDAARSLIYKWCYWIGLWEIRKFMSKKEMREAFKKYHE